MHRSLRVLLVEPPESPTRFWYNHTRIWRCTGPGGSRRLQNGCSGSFLFEGGFDSHAPPPATSELDFDTNVLFSPGESGRIERVTRAIFRFLTPDLTPNAPG